MASRLPSLFSFLWLFPTHISSKLESRVPRGEHHAAGKIWVVGNTPVRGQCLLAETAWLWGSQQRFLCLTRYCYIEVQQILCSPSWEGSHEQARHGDKTVYSLTGLLQVAPQWEACNKLLGSRLGSGLLEASSQAPVMQYMKQNTEWAVFKSHQRKTGCYANAQEGEMSSSWDVCVRRGFGGRQHLSQAWKNWVYFDTQRWGDGRGYRGQGRDKGEDSRARLQCIKSLWEKMWLWDLITRGLLLALYNFQSILWSIS